MPTACSVASCDRPVFSRGWCSAHYFRWKRWGHLRAEVPIGGARPAATCEAEDCHRATYGRQRWCELHYRRWRRTGSPDRPERPRRCRVDDCDRDVSAHGLCHGHYQRVRRLGHPQADVPLGRRRQPESCTVEGCDRGTHTRGLCRAHHKRYLKHGRVVPDVPIREADGTGSISHGYRIVCVPAELRHLTHGESYAAEHRLVMAIRLGRPLRPDENVHHRNGIRTDNRLENLELWSTSQPHGQRVQDKVAHALEVLTRYAPEALAPPYGERVGTSPSDDGPSPHDATARNSSPEAI